MKPDEIKAVWLVWLTTWDGDVLIDVYESAESAIAGVGRLNVAERLSYKAAGRFYPNEYSFTRKEVLK